MSAIRAIIFDLDGTLVDTAPDLHAALSVAFREHNLPPVSIDAVRSSVGFGALAMIRKALTILKISVDADVENKLFEAFIKHYRVHIAELSKPYDHCRETLNFLSKNKITLAVCTNKPRDLAMPLLEGLKLNQYFEFVSGGTCPPNKKPHKDHLEHVLSAIEMRPEHALMVGDTHVDIAAAHNARVRSVILTHGYSDQPCENIDATWLFHNFQELNDHLKMMI